MNFSKIDDIENCIINHLIRSETKTANIFWKILKYSDVEDIRDIQNLSEIEKLELVNSYPISKISCKNDGQLYNIVSACCNPSGNNISEIYENFRKDLSKISSEICPKVSIIVDTFSISYNGKSVSIKIQIYDCVSPKYVIYEDSDYQFKGKNRLLVLMKCLIKELIGLEIPDIGTIQFSKDYNELQFAPDSYEHKITVKLYIYEEKNNE